MKNQKKEYREACLKIIRKKQRKRKQNCNICKWIFCEKVSKYLKPLLYYDNIIGIKKERKNHMLELKNITKDYISGDSKIQALKGISIEFRKSEFVSILGQSGCGKTTLLNIIGGLDRYTRRRFNNKWKIYKRI